MIIVRLQGGLGNQMFQYAAGRGLAIRCGSPLLLDTRDLEADPLRAYALDGFCIQSEIATKQKKAAMPQRVHPRLRWLPRWPGKKVRYFAEMGFGFDPDILETKAPVYIDGYWQSERYFLEYANEIRTDFQLRDPFLPDRQAIAAIIDTSLAVSLHVRRGDYVSNAATNAYHGTVEPEWYASAMAEVEAQVGACRYFVFSDDPVWARANLPAHSRMHFVAPSTDGRDYEDMHLMARCRHHIIANSSFSWWGAWLNPQPNKLVIAPSNWFRSAALNTADLLPPTWLKL